MFTPPTKINQAVKDSWRENKEGTEIVKVLGNHHINRACKVTRLRLWDDSPERRANGKVWCLGGTVG